MESGAILDKDIVASSNKPGYEPWKGRLHGRSCWMPSADKNSEYISVTLSGKVNITAIATQGAVTDRCWVTSYEIHYYDGSYFTRYPKVKHFIIFLMSKDSKPVSYVGEEVNHQIFTIFSNVARLPHIALVLTSAHTATTSRRLTA